MVYRCNISKYQPDHFGKLYRSGNQCGRMPKRFINSYCGYRKCLTGNTYYISRRATDLLCRRKCNTYFQCRYNLFMVYRCNISKYQPDNIGKLYRSGNQRSRMPECSFSSNNRNSKSFANYIRYIKCMRSIDHPADWLRYSSGFHAMGIRDTGSCYS